MWTSAEQRDAQDAVENREVEADDGDDRLYGERCISALARRWREAVYETYL